MSVQKSKNDIAWEALFNERPILQDVDTIGFHSISASVINTKREARLMTKLDHKINLPKIFKDNGLAILPDSRSSYIIGRFQCYADLDQTLDGEIIEKTFPDWIQSLSPDKLYSEASALLCAQYAGLITEVLEEDVSFTVFGRMSTGEFDFSILAAYASGAQVAQSIRVDRAQCEIDGGFEGAETFAIMEVKNDELEDFHIRQLYYPYRLWQNKISKRIVPVFLTYSNEVFTFRIYDFAQPKDYNSLRLVRKKRYQIVPTEIALADIRRILAETQPQPEPADIPFPQADRFERVINMLTRLRAANGKIAKDEITTNYAFDIRQTQYYTDASRYLGLIERSRESCKGVLYSLTPTGIQLMNKAPRLRNLDLIRLILSRKVFRDAVEYYLANAEPPTSDMVKGFIQKAKLPINDTTAGRRAQSVIGWVRWIIGLTTDA